MPRPRHIEGSRDARGGRGKVYDRWAGWWRGCGGWEQRHTGQLKIGGLLRLDEVQENICEPRLGLGLQQQRREKVSVCDVTGVGRSVLGAASRRGQDVCRRRTHPHKHVPASAEAQPSVGHRHRRRALQRCSFEWRRHPLSFNLSGQKLASRRFRKTAEMSGKEWPEAKRVFGGCRGGRARKNLGQNLVASRSARAPKWRGIKLGVGSGKFTLCRLRRCQRAASRVQAAAWSCPGAVT